MVYFVDALIVAGVKGISRRNTHNVLKSFCPIMSNNYHGDKKTKCMGRKLYNEQDVMITDHKHDCIFHNCILSDFNNQCNYAMKVLTRTKLLLGINGNMFLRSIQSQRKMKRNILIKLDTQVLQPNCLHYLRGHCTIIQFIYSTFDGKPCSLKNVKNNLVLEM